jgi:hypothetical protein
MWKWIEMCKNRGEYGDELRRAAHLAGFTDTPDASTACTQLNAFEDELRATHATTAAKCAGQVDVAGGEDVSLLTPEDLWIGSMTSIKRTASGVEIPYTRYLCESIESAYRMISTMGSQRTLSYPFDILVANDGIARINARHSLIAEFKSDGGEAAAGVREEEVPRLWLDAFGQENAEFIARTGRIINVVMVRLFSQRMLSDEWSRVADRIGKEYILAGCPSDTLKERLVRELDMAGLQPVNITDAHVFYSVLHALALGRSTLFGPFPIVECVAALLVRVGGDERARILSLLSTEMEQSVRGDENLQASRELQASVNPNEFNRVFASGGGACWPGVEWASRFGFDAARSFVSSHFVELRSIPLMQSLVREGLVDKQQVYTWVMATLPKHRRDTLRQGDFTPDSIDLHLSALLFTIIVTQASARFPLLNFVAQAAAAMRDELTLMRFSRLISEHASLLDYTEQIVKNEIARGTTRYTSNVHVLFRPPYLTWHTVPLENVGVASPNSYSLRDLIVSETESSEQLTASPPYFRPRAAQVAYSVPNDEQWPPFDVISLETNLSRADSVTELVAEQPNLDDTLHPIVIRFFSSQLNDTPY